ncbi:HK97 family phage prohead protease [Bacillus sp. ISL-40]|uniref:HK97 family phage prohead protease n=1 Tax=unclassified Bacillus (in: firmicutes) TaxID=185979 RepID=UPI001BE80489|nr:MULTISPECIES: HK97 family phage prohead protease [unclassified Bacillus (in: firmicutes)]MBT2696352.1 HK97 family phage prohead protease [Bacillus sp. ISL-40]MBT2743201.1 HK97 family phage prohead protease [Bacillus sp. ISL-77]
MGKKNKLPLKEEPVIRSFGIADLRAADDENVIEGHPAVYDQKTLIGGYFNEIIERGAFDGCNFDDVLFCVNHDLRKIPLARSRRNNGSSTMQLATDEKGLHIKASLDVEGNTEAKSLYSAVKRGDIDGMSFIFYVQEERWVDLDKEIPTRYISRIKQVREVSAVTFPAYSGTDINARDQATLDNAARALENARSELDNSKNEVEALRLKIKNKGLI